MNRLFLILLILTGLTFGTPVAEAQFFQPAPSFTFTYRANWNNTTAYSAGDAVRSPSNGMLYVATASVTGGADPGSSSTPPSPWASPFRGVIAQGPPGADGADGSNGSSLQAYFRDGATQPPVQNPSYSNPPTGWSRSVPVSAEPIWILIYRLDGDGTTFTQVALFQISGPRGPPGTAGQDGQDGAVGPRGLTGAAGTDGDNGISSRFAYRKTETVELTIVPAITYDGSQIQLPSTDQNAWQLQPYISKTYNSWTIGQVSNAGELQDIDVDETVNPNVAYILVGGSTKMVHRYSLTGTYISSFSISDIENPIDLDIQGNVVRILDGSTPGATNQQVYVYTKGDGLRSAGQDFLIARNASGVIRTISHEGASLYFVTERSVRRFSFGGAEQTSGILTSLGSNITRPRGSDADPTYFYILDQTDRRIYTRFTDALMVRRETKEWNLDTDNGNPVGFSITDNSAYVLDQVDNRVYVYYSPEQPLWGVTFYYTVGTSGATVSLPFQMEGPPGSDTVTVQGTGIGRDGNPGNSIDIVFAAVGANDNPPAKPVDGTGTAVNGALTVAPTDWHLTVAAAIVGQGADYKLYESIAYIPGATGGRIRYSGVGEFRGPRGPPGAQGTPGTAAAAGNSYLLLYQTAATEPNLPTGGVWNPTTSRFTTDPTYNGWRQQAYTSIPDGQNLYISFVLLPGAGGTPTYGHPQEIPRGGEGVRGPAGPAGNDGARGSQGQGFTLIFREGITEPELPTGGTWNGTTFRAPSNWSLNAPNRPANDPENLYATGVELPSSPTGIPVYTGVFQLNGQRGLQGIQGPEGNRGVGTEIIFRIGTVTPDAPTAGSGTWDPATNSYTPPTGWSLDSTGFTGTQNLYAVKVTLLATAEETYGTVWQMNGPPGAIGPRGPPGGMGGQPGSGTNGDSLDAIYRTSTTTNDQAILGTRPTGGTRSGSELTAAPTNWLLQPPSSIARGTYVYLSIADLSGDGTTITYDVPIQLTGYEGRDGAAGSTGATGARGDRGISSGFLYQRASSTPVRPTNGTGTYSNEAITLSGWTDDTTSGTGLLYAVGWVYNSAGSTAADRIKYTPVWQMEGPPGERGQQGPRGADGSGTGGNDGSSAIFMYRATTDTLRNAPTGGSWVRSSHTFTPPNNWYETYAGAVAAGNSGDPVYAVAVYLSGTADAVNAYSHPIRLTGPQGPRGLTGERGLQGIQGRQGEIGPRGPAGIAGRFYLPIFRRAASKPSNPSGLRYSGGALLGAAASGWLREAPDPTDTEPVWEALIEINPNTGSAIPVTIAQFSGTRGPAGERGPQGEQGPAGRDGVPNVPRPTQIVKFGIISDSTNRELRSSRTGTDTNIWSPWGKNGNAGTSGIQEIRGNFSGVGNPNIATQNYTEILNDASLTGGVISTGFSNMPRQPQTYRPLRIIPSSNAAVQSGQTASVTIEGGLRSGVEIGTGTQFSRPFRRSVVTYNFDVINGVVQTLITPIAVSDFQQITFNNFTAGTVDIEFAEGIRIEQDDLYQLELQIDTRITGTADTGELVITLYIEDEDGGEVGSYIAQSHDIQTGLAEEVTFPDYIPAGPLELSEGDHIYFVYTYIGASRAGDSDENKVMTLRVNNHVSVDDRLLIRKYIQSGGGSGGGTEGPAGESVERIWTRATSTPVTPRASDIRVDENGRFTSLTSGGVVWDDEPVPAGTGNLYEQAIGRRGTTIRIIGTPFDITGPQGATGARGPAGNDGARGPAGANGAAGAAGANGISYRYYYSASTANTINTPNINYTGTAFDPPPSGWSITIPTTPTGANVFSAIVKYREGTAGENVDGIVIIGTVPGTVAPPAGQTTYTMSYGIVTGGPGYSVTPTSNTLPTLSLAPGDTGSFDNLMMTNSQTHPNFYFDLPAGLTLVNVYNTNLGVTQATDDWTTDDSSNPRRYINDSFDPVGDMRIRVDVRR